ncbi:MAG: hypothetical protein Kow0042_15250 [Calditrichia bacterium]
MKRYQNVSLVDLPLSPYDIIIVSKDELNEETIIRAQVKKTTKSINFTGGSRGGVDRIYKSGVKTYIHSPKTADIIIGVHPITEDSLELYFVPTVFIEILNQKSISLSKIAILKNNYFFLENCKKRKVILRESKRLGLLKI